MASLEEVTLELTHFSSLIPLCVQALCCFGKHICTVILPARPPPQNSNCSAAKCCSSSKAVCSCWSPSLSFAWSLRMRAARASPVSPVSVTPAPPVIRLDTKECFSECREGMAHSAESGEYLDCAQVVVDILDGGCGTETGDLVDWR